MPTFSATQAISPAIERTKQLLFQPFRWGTFLKLSTVAILTGGGSSGNFNSGSNFGHHNTTTTSQITTGMPHMPLNPAWIVAAAFFALALIVIGIWLFYLVVRLRFALFDCLIHQTKLIRPGWHKYRFQAFRYFLLCIVVGVVFFAVLAALAVPFVFGFMRIYQESQTTGQFPLGGFIALLLPLLPILILIVFASIAVSIILQDFMLPHIALENASAGQAWAGVRARIMAEKGSFLLYAVLRIFLPIITAIGLFIVLIIPGIIVFGLLGGSLAGLHILFTGAPLGLKVLGIVFQVILGLVIAALLLLVVISVGGPVSIAFRNFALVFYGARYQTLGDILYPPQPPPAPLPEPGIA
jgi:hypothetical protein